MPIKIQMQIELYFANFDVVQTNLAFEIIIMKNCF